MELSLPLREAVDVLTAMGVLPGAVTDVRAQGAAVLARVRVDELPGVPGAVRAVARLAPAADARIDDRGVVGRTWTLALEVRHPLLPIDVSGFVTDAVRAQLAKAPAGVAQARWEANRTLVEVDLDALPGLLPIPPGVAVVVQDVALGETVRVRAGLAPAR